MIEGESQGEDVERGEGASVDISRENVMERQRSGGVNVNAAPFVLPLQHS